MSRLEDDEDNGLQDVDTEESEEGLQRIADELLLSSETQWDTLTAVPNAKESDNKNTAPFFAKHKGESSSSSTASSKRAAMGPPVPVPPKAKPQSAASSAAAIAAAPAAKKPPTAGQLLFSSKPGSSTKPAAAVPTDKADNKGTKTSRYPALSLTVSASSTPRKRKQDESDTAGSGEEEPTPSAADPDDEVPLQQSKKRKTAPKKRIDDDDDDAEMKTENDEEQVSASAPASAALPASAPPPPPPQPKKNPPPPELTDDDPNHYLKLREVRSKADTDDEEQVKGMQALIAELKKYIKPHKHISTAKTHNYFAQPKSLKTWQDWFLFSHLGYFMRRNVANFGEASLDKKSVFDVVQALSRLEADPSGELVRKADVDGILSWSVADYDKLAAHAATTASGWGGASLMLNLNREQWLAGMQKALEKANGTAPEENGDAKEESTPVVDKEKPKPKLKPAAAATTTTKAKAKTAAAAAEAPAPAAQPAKSKESKLKSSSSQPGAGGNANDSDVEMEDAKQTKENKKKKDDKEKDDREKKNADLLNLTVIPPALVDDMFELLKENEADQKTAMFTHVVAAVTPESVTATANFMKLVTSRDYARRAMCNELKDLLLGGFLAPDSDRHDARKADLARFMQRLNYPTVETARKLRDMFSSVAPESLFAAPVVSSVEGLYSLSGAGAVGAAGARNKEFKTSLATFPADCYPALVLMYRMLSEFEAATLFNPWTAASKERLKPAANPTRLSAFHIRSASIMRVIYNATFEYQRKFAETHNLMDDLKDVRDSDEYALMTMRVNMFVSAGTLLFGV